MTSPSDCLPKTQEQLNEAYSDEQFYKDYPEKILKCKYCKKKFTTPFDARYCSDKCATKFLFYHNKSDRNLVGKDARRLKGTGRRKSW
jgi:hypothetical protein